MNQGKYITLWNKYINVIRIKLNNSIKHEEELQLSKVEFEAAGDRDSAGYSFNIEISKGKVINDISGTAVARDLFNVLNSNPKTKEFLMDKHLKIYMGTSFMLKMKLVSINIANK